MTIKSLIIDDNVFIIDLLRDQLEQYHKEVRVIDIATNGSEGLEKIKRHKPDLIFLDVEMPGMNGFELLAQCKDISFQTIFITSYSHYAIKAIRFNALDYLVKPIEIEELGYAIKRYHKNADNLVNQLRVAQALINLKQQNAKDEILILQTQTEELRISLKHIIRIESDRNYSYILLTNATKKLSSKTLGYFDEILSDKGFFRCHRSFLINKIHVDSIVDKKSFLSTDGTKTSIARRKKTAAYKWFSSLEER